MTTRITSEMMCPDPAREHQQLVSRGCSGPRANSPPARRSSSRRTTPTGPAGSIELQSQLDGLTSYATNVQEGISWENTATGAHVEHRQVLQRVRELVVAGRQRHQQPGRPRTRSPPRSNSSPKRSSRTRTPSTPASTSSRAPRPPPRPTRRAKTTPTRATTGTIARAIGPGASVTVNTNISTLLGNGTASGDGKLLDTLRTIARTCARARRAGSSTTTDLTKLRREHRNACSQLQADGGQRHRPAADRPARGSKACRARSPASLSDTQDTNIAEATIAYSNEQAAYTAALHAGATIIQESLLNFLK